MIDPRNVVVISGGIVSDPEVVNENIIKFRIGVDYAGSEKGSSNNSGYFDITYYTNNDNRNAGFVKDQVSSGKMKKGSQVAIVGRLVHERWGEGDSRGQRVVIVAESVSYSGSLRDNSAEGSAPATSQQAVPAQF